MAAAYGQWRTLLFIDARRSLSIVFNSVISWPFFYLGLVRVLDYALCVPVFLFEAGAYTRPLFSST